MDLAKIIAELRAELQSFDTAIASIEELARLQNLYDADIPADIQSELKAAPPGPDPEDPAPVKRRRGRPRKIEPRESGETPPPKEPGAADSGANSSDDSTASAA